MSDKYKNRRYLIEVGNVLILSSHLQSLLLHFLPLIQPGSIGLLNGILCHHVPKATFRDSHSTTVQRLTEWRKNDNRNVGYVFVICHVRTRRLGHTFPFFPTTKDNIPNTQLSKHKPETADSQENKNSHKQNTTVMVECSMFLLLCQLLAVLSNYTAFWFWTRFEWLLSSYTPQGYQLF